MKKWIWKLKYAWYMQRRSGIGWGFAWHSAGCSYDDLVCDDGSIENYGPIDSADCEMSYWSD